MNTDNMTISGETIDYGPCAFMDAYDPETVFSSIDYGGRYAFGNQPPVAQWNLARFAETLLPLIDDEHERAVAAATTVLNAFTDRFDASFAEGARAKIGLTEDPGDDGALIADLLSVMRAQGVDFTSFFRALSATLRGGPSPARDLFTDRAPFDAWSERWHAELAREGRDHETTAAAMDRVNPVYVPRNHLVEEALAAATAGDMDPFGRLLEAVSRPFDEREGLERYAEPAPDSFGKYVTYCGT
jgi:serine/tyrosine/threonine adenylyltransferase